ncbi:MAG TPA: type IV toxin-antitoxin system AbiEi family antitoxin domain-containing protein [Pseudolysinimonas sp.]|nr:type IV toxin-antitoxin system AbiEi family antitoxin domain-containing protein [Pseudolysinimonas sp.]
MDLEAWIESRGGYALVADLRRAGFRDRHLGRAVARGRVRRPRRGVYSTRSPGDPEFRALAVGGRLTGVSALHLMGAWLREPPALLHVAVARHATAIEHPHGTRIHWVETHGGTLTRVALADALVQSALDEPLEVVVPLFDWAHRARRLDLFRFEEILLRLPADLQVLRDWVDPRSQSILESVARVRCRRRGWRVRSQVGVGDLGSIDLVIEDAVALELDGRRFHESTFHADRAKDLQITREGRHSLRVDASLLFRSWPAVEAAIERALHERALGGDNLGTTTLRVPEHRPRRPVTPRSSELVAPTRE